jgi:hypothetical protein
MRSYKKHTPTEPRAFSIPGLARLFCSHRLNIVERETPTCSAVRSFYRSDHQRTTICRAVENVVNVHDLHATMLALMGIDHKRLSTKYQGLNVRLTKVAGTIAKPPVA